MSTKTLLTADEFELMPDDDSVRTELDEGELITMPLAGGEHGYIAGEIGAELWRYVKKYKLGRAYGRRGSGLGLDTESRPRRAFVRKERIEAIQTPGIRKGAPDVEVESESLPPNSVRQLRRKVKQYLAAGCHTVWVLYPKRKQVDVYEGSGVIRTVSGKEVLEAPELLPGFSVRVAELFE